MQPRDSRRGRVSWQWRGRGASACPPAAVPTLRRMFAHGPILTVHCKRRTASGTPDHCEAWRRHRRLPVPHGAHMHRLAHRGQDLSWHHQATGAHPVTTPTPTTSQGFAKNTEQARCNRDRATPHTVQRAEANALAAHCPTADTTAGSGHISTHGHRVPGTAAQRARPATRTCLLRCRAPGDSVRVTKRNQQWFKDRPVLLVRVSSDTRPTRGT